MALVTHQVQGPYAPSRSSWKIGFNSTKYLAPCCKVWRTDYNLLKHSSCIGVDAPIIQGSKQKSSRISSFKASIQSDEYRDRVRGSQSVKNSVKLSFISSDDEETLSGLPKVQNIHAFSTADADVITSGSLAVHKLFKSWVTLLHTTSPDQVETFEGLTSNDKVETEHKLLKGGIFKTVWRNFLSMDAKIKIPAIIFIPLFVIVNVKYGVLVAKELSPLWIGGPMLVALYIKMLQVIYSLYVFSFNQWVKVVKNFARGKTEESIHVCSLQHVVYFRNLDYKDESKRIWKEFQAWMGDKCLDYVESMWSYRRTIGLLKMTKIM